MTTEVTWKKVALAVMVTLPLTAQAVVIDNGIPIGNVRHLSVDVLTGGATESVVFTMRRYNSNNPTDPNDLITHNVVSSYRAFVDPGNDGHGFALHGSDSRPEGNLRHQQAHAQSKPVARRARLA